MPGEMISPELAASLVQSGMWLDYGATLCEPDVFDKALAARKEELENVKIRSCLSVRPRAVIEEDPEGEHFHLFSWHFSAYERRKHDAGRCNYTPLNLGEVPGLLPAFSWNRWTLPSSKPARWTTAGTSTLAPRIFGSGR